MKFNLVYSFRNIPQSFFTCLAAVAGITAASCAMPIFATTCLLLFAFYALYTVGYSIKIFVFYVFIFLIGFMTYTVQRINFENFETYFCDKKINAICIVNDIKYDETKVFKYILELSVNRIYISEQTKKIKKTVILNCLTKPHVKAHQKILIKNLVLKKITDEEFKKYLLRMNIANSTFINKLNYKIVKSDKTFFSTAEKIEKLKKNLMQRIQEKSQRIPFLFFESIFMGNKEQFNYTEYKYAHNFNQWGIAHILARSGLHLSILLFLLQGIMNRGFLPFLLQRIIVLLFMLFFYVTSTPATPFIRAFFMYLIHEHCILLRLATHTLHIFCLATTCMLLFNPMQLFFLDFQLSFGITLLLLLWSYK